MNETAFSFDPDWMGTLTAPFMTKRFPRRPVHRLGCWSDGLLHHRPSFHVRRACAGAHRTARSDRSRAVGSAGQCRSRRVRSRRSLVIGALGKKASQREIATGTVLAFATGMGLFFARLSSSASQQMQSILFGSILTITDGQIVGFAVFDVLLLAVLAVIYRPLLFSSLDEQVAQAKGVPVNLMNICFMAIMAGVITIAVPAVGTLLIFALVVTPAATANIISRSPFAAMVVSTVICLISIWGGLLVSAMFPAPPSFIIVTISTLFWIVAKNNRIGTPQVAKVSADRFHQGAGDGRDALARTGESHAVGSGGRQRHFTADGMAQRLLRLVTALADFRTIGHDDHACAHRPHAMRTQIRNRRAEHLVAVLAGTGGIGTDTEKHAYITQSGCGKQRVNQRMGCDITVRIAFDAVTIPTQTGKP